MGYSATAKALDTHANLLKILQKDNPRPDTDAPSNQWADAQGHVYFEEIGRENTDGAVTGTVFKMIADGRCRTFGSYRIGADGKITRFPGTTAAQRERAIKI